MAAPSGIRICFVCLGNICRSPMAAAILRRRLYEAGLADAVTVESAGTGRWHVGGPADPRPWPRCATAAWTPTITALGSSPARRSMTMT